MEERSRRGLRRGEVRWSGGGERRRGDETPVLRRCSEGSYFVGINTHRVSSSGCGKIRRQNKERTHIFPLTTVYITGHNR